MERIDVPTPGRVEVAGRWFGVRGRRFVRPALTFASREGGESRSLADLEHKPWAAEDGEPWFAAFDFEGDFDKATSIELSVSPDINVILRAPNEKGVAVGETLLAARRASITDRSGRRGSTTSARRLRPTALSAPTAGAAATAPTADTPAATEKAPTSRSRPAEPERRKAPGEGQELLRLQARLNDAGQALESERERRAAVDRTLEQERAANRKLQTEVGRLRADLELARAAEVEASETAKQLDASRKELEAADERRQAIEIERDRALEAQAAVRTALQERTDALEATREALADERTETGRLHSRVKGLQEAREAAEARAAAAARAAASAYNAPARDDSETTRTDVTRIDSARSRTRRDEDATVADTRDEDATVADRRGEDSTVAGTRDEDATVAGIPPGVEGSGDDAGQDTRSFTIAEAASLLGPESPEPARGARTAPAAPPQAWERIAEAVLPAGDDDPTRLQAAGERRTVQISGDSGQFRHPAPHHGPPPPERPVNPALRHRGEWIPRALAVLVLAIMIVVVLLLIGSGGH